MTRHIQVNMNISPTPKRYNNKRNFRMSDYRDVDDYYYNADYHDNLRRGNLNYNSGPSSYNNEKEKLIPKEYKESKQTIDELLTQIRVLNKRLNDKQQENMRLNSLVDTLRNKLLKYTELSKQYKNERDELSNKLYTRNISECENDMIQLNKRRGNGDQKSSNTNLNNVNDNIPSSVSINSPSTEISSVSKNSLSTRSENLEVLTSKMDKIYEVLNNLQSMKADNLNPPNTSNSTSDTSTSINNTNMKENYPSEQDIIIKETEELKKLEDSIQEYRRKVQIKRDNDKRKTSLQEELLRLQKDLGEVNMNSFHNNKNGANNVRSVSNRDILKNDNVLNKNNNNGNYNGNNSGDASDFNVGSFLRSSFTTSN